MAERAYTVPGHYYTDEWLAEHTEDDYSLPVGFTAQILEDCKHMAIAFAENVS